MVYQEFQVFRAEQKEFNQKLLDTLQRIDENVQKQNGRVKKLEDAGATVTTTTTVTSGGENLLSKGVVVGLVSQTWFPYIALFVLLVLYQSGVIPTIVNYFTQKH
jgi:hypothetical protein